MGKVIDFIASPAGALIGGKVGKMMAGASYIAIGVMTGQPQLVLLGASRIQSALSSDASQKRQASVTNLSVGEVPREVVFGEAVVGGSLADAFNYGGKNDTDWEVLKLALSDCECEALVGFYVNDKYVAFAGDGEVAGYKGQLKVWWRPGTEHQTVPQILIDEGGCTANDNGAGVCFVVVAYKADKADAKKPVWSGRPRFRFRLKGAKVYQARKDGSIGGAGAHRRALPATWAWSDNPIDCRYAWVRGIYACNRVDDPAMLLVGRGLTAVEAPPQNVFARANVCDELVDGEKRYRIGGAVQSAESYAETEDLFAAAMAGTIVQPEGSIEIDPGQAKSPVAWITDDDILIGSNVSYSEFLSRGDREWVNTVAPRFVDPAQMWADHAAPILRDPADVIADKAPREETLALALVTWAKQTARVGEIRRRLGRLWKRGALTLGPRFCALEEGDWIVWTSQRRFAGASVMFQIGSYLLDEKWQNRLTLREISASVYSAAAFDPDQAAPMPPSSAPVLAGPAPGSWVLTSEKLGDALPVLVVSGAADDDYAETVRFEYWRDDGVTDIEDAPWVGPELAAASVTRREIATVAGGGSYYAAVSYLVGGEPTDRLVLGPVTVGALAGSVPADDLPELSGDEILIGLKGGATGRITTQKLAEFIMAQMEPVETLGPELIVAGDTMEQGPWGYGEAGEWTGSAARNVTESGIVCAQDVSAAIEPNTAYRITVTRLSVSGELFAEFQTYFSGAETTSEAIAKEGVSSVVLSTGPSPYFLSFRIADALAPSEFNGVSVRKIL